MIECEKIERRPLRRYCKKENLLMGGVKVNVSLGLLITLIGLLCTATGVALGLLTFIRNRKNEIKSNVKNDATESAIISTKLDNIGQSLDSIRIDLKASDQRWTTLSGTVIRIDESTKQAHKRIDKIEHKGEV